MPDLPTALSVSATHESLRTVVQPSSGARRRFSYVPLLPSPGALQRSKEFEHRFVRPLRAGDQHEQRHPSRQPCPGGSSRSRAAIGSVPTVQRAERQEERDRDGGHLRDRRRRPGGPRRAPSGTGRPRSAPRSPRRRPRPRGHRRPGTWTTSSIGSSARPDAARAASIAVRASATSSGDVSPMTKYPSNLAARRCGALLGHRPPIQIGIPPGRVAGGRNVTPAARWCGAVVVDLLPGQQPGQHLEALVEHRGADLGLDRLAERRQLAAVTVAAAAVVAQAEAEDQAAAGEPVERGRLARQHLGAAPGQRRDHRSRAGSARWSSPRRRGRSRGRRSRRRGRRRAGGPRRTTRPSPPPRPALARSANTRGSASGSNAGTKSPRLLTALPRRPGPTTTQTQTPTSCRAAARPPRARARGPRRRAARTTTPGAPAPPPRAARPRCAAARR